LTSDGGPVRGSARLTSGDQQRFLLAVLGRRPAFLGLVCLTAGAFAIEPLLVRHYDDARWRGASIAGALIETAPAILGSSAVVVLIVALVLLVHIGLAVPWSVRRIGPDRRALTYEIDDAGVRTRDGLGAELTLPWSNLTRVVRTKRLLLLRLKPRGWRYVIVRAFAPEDVVRIGELAVAHGVGFDGPRARSRRLGPDAANPDGARP
jgi:hypothetical protein